MCGSRIKSFHFAVPFIMERPKDEEEAENFLRKKLCSAERQNLLILPLKTKTFRPFLTEKKLFFRSLQAWNHRKSSRTRWTPSYPSTTPSHSTAKQKARQSRESIGSRMAKCSKLSPARIKCSFRPATCSSWRSYIRDARAMPACTGARPKMNSEQREVVMRHSKLLVGLNHFNSSSRNEFT